MEKTVRKKVHDFGIEKILIGLFCLAVLVIVALVMFETYDPDKNSLGALCSVCMDIICIVILIILIGSFAFGNYGSTKTTKIYAVLLVTNIWALFMDFLNWAYDGTLMYGNRTFWFTLGSLCTAPLLVALFVQYLYNYMEETHGLKGMKIRARVCSVINYCWTIIAFVLSVMGLAFTFVDGHYETGIMYDMVTVIPVVSLIYITGFIIRHVKTVGIHDVITVSCYILFMLYGAFIEETYCIGTTYVAVSIANIFIFAMLQNEVIAHEKRTTLEWMEKSQTDELTGLLNRHAYEADLKEIEATEPKEDFVFVSIDVNSLKAINDSLGHNAGDEVLIGASECLRDSLGEYGKIYRTGGDEFIALINASEKQLENIKNSLEESSKKWKGRLVDSIALSFGYVTRREPEEMSVRQMAVLADQRMYEAKNDYYRRSGIDRRRQ